MTRGVRALFLFPRESPRRLTGTPLTPEAPYKAVVYDPRARSWYNEATDSATPSVWSSPYVFSDGVMLGVSATRRFTRGPGGDMFGVVSLDFTLNDIETALVDFYGRGDDSGRASAVWIVERRTGRVIASTVGLAPLSHIRDANDTRIAAAEAALARSDWVDGIFDHGGAAHWVFARPYRDVQGLEWNVTVLREVRCAAGYGLEGATCVACDSALGLTSTAESTACDSCVAGYYRNARGWCSACPRNATCDDLGIYEEARDAADAGAPLVRVGIFAPLSAADGRGPYVDGAYRVMSAAGAWAAALFNARDASVVAAFGDLGGCAARLQVTHHDTYATTAETVQRYIEARDYLDAIVGPTYSKNAAPLSINAAVDETPVVSYFAMSSDLDDKVTHPYFTRVLPADVDVAPYVADRADMKMF